MTSVVQPVTRLLSPARGKSHAIVHTFFGKKTPGGAGTHTGHTGHTGARAGTRITRTNLTTIHPNPTTQTRTKTARITRTNLTSIHPNPTTQTRTKTATNSTAARAAASPESTAPRGRLRRGRHRRTRPCLHRTGTELDTSSYPFEYNTRVSNILQHSRRPRTGDFLN